MHAYFHVYIYVYILHITYYILQHPRIFQRDFRRGFVPFVYQYTHVFENEKNTKIHYIHTTYMYTYILLYYIYIHDIHIYGTCTMCTLTSTVPKIPTKINNQILILIFDIDIYYYNLIQYIIDKL